jgi:hypothetical protein
MVRSLFSRQMSLVGFSISDFSDAVLIQMHLCSGRYTKTDLVFGFSENQILVAVILGQNSFWVFPKTILR